jgi:hypothetical protein
VRTSGGGRVRCQRRCGVVCGWAQRTQRGERQVSHSSRSRKAAGALCAHLDAVLRCSGGRHYSSSAHRHQLLPPQQQMDLPAVCAAAAVGEWMGAKPRPPVLSMHLCQTSEPAPHLNSCTFQAITPTAVKHGRQAAACVSFVFSFRCSFVWWCAGASPFKCVAATMC